jgi:hypothetical protein
LLNGTAPVFTSGLNVRPVAWLAAGVAARGGQIYFAWLYLLYFFGVEIFICDVLTSGVRQS